MSEPTVHPVFEPATGTFQYIVGDPSTKAAVVIDPVLDFESGSSSIKTASADALLSLITAKGYDVRYILETHAHADHLSAASYLQAQLGKTGTRPEIGIGQRIVQVQKLFGKRYGVPATQYELVFDRLFSDDEIFNAGNLQIKAIHLPGHTPDHMGYCIGRNVFCGDSLFHSDIGTARTDFPGGSAHQLWESSQKLLAFPGETRIWTGHDYPPEDRKMPMPFMTVDQHKERNKHVMTGRSREEFVTMRRQRDAALGAPRLLHQSLQINVRGGRLPEVDESGQRMVMVPLKLSGAEAW
ncbi:beta-lactamase-like protein [Boeremia exigua]|uniref:beta-lactamase-like protein n=1 Tax=Boeremia exigua TaxID=749465 RepID=UPI001E8CE0B0|nr:beta-lactamase-like protein [Boeremia exigua]KAH6639477.1 beta-lactamase-like protein [Boeremia exigua]